MFVKRKQFDQASENQRGAIEEIVTSYKQRLSAAFDDIEKMQSDSTDFGTFKQSMLITRDNAIDRLEKLMETVGRGRGASDKDLRYAWDAFQRASSVTYEQLKTFNGSSMEKDQQNFTVKYSTLDIPGARGELMETKVHTKSHGYELANAIRGSHEHARALNGLASRLESALGEFMPKETSPRR